MRPLRFVVLFASASFLAISLSTACSLDWDSESAAIAEDGGSNPNLGDAPDDTAEVDQGGWSSDATTEADAKVEADADAAVPQGDACSPSTPCGPSSYCHYSDHVCGSGYGGHCQPTPASCADAQPATSCGCNTTVYLSPCAAAQGGVDTSSQAACSTPGGSFRCGYRYCANTDYCMVTGASPNFEYECRPLNGCALGCLCLPILACLGGTCSAPGGHVLVNCPP